MKTLTLLLLAAALGADELPATGARITDVTVYADRAEVVRTFTGRLEPGERTLVFDDLPAGTLLDQLRVEGGGRFTLVDIRPEVAQTGQPANEKVRALQQASRVQELRLEAVAQAEARLKFQKEALEKVLGRLTSAGKNSPGPEMDPQKWAAFLDFQDGQLAEIDRQTIALQREREAVQSELDRLVREAGVLRGTDSRARLRAKVTLDVAEAGEAVVRLSYVVRGPGWSPTYDMRADTKAGRLEVTYKAQVRQSTGEDWKGVALRLSTAQPGVHGREPKMNPWFLQKAEPVLLGSSFGGGVATATSAPAAAAKRVADKDRMQQMHNGFQFDNLNGVMEPQDAAGEKKAEMAELRATVRDGGAAATYAIERRTDIAQDNKPVLVTIMRESFASKFRHTCVPKLSPFVYLKTKAVNATDFTFLPGPTSVFLDGAFVAQASLDLVPSGQEFWTYLGVDQDVTVDLRLLGRREESSGVFSRGTARTVFDHQFRIRNGKGAAVELVLWDQIPVSNHEDIRVVLEEPVYEKDNEGLRMNESKFLEWKIDLKGGEKRDIPFRFAVERPKDMQVVGLSNGL